MVRQPGSGTRALVCVNGESDQYSLQQLKAEHFDLLLAVDGGLRHALALGLAPDCIIGDMDSVDPDTLAQLERTGCTVLRHPAEKDATDLELALLYLSEQNIDELVLLGITGGRLDHLLANVLLLGRQNWPFSIRFVASSGNGYLITQRQSFEQRLRQGTEISLLALGGDARGVSTSGLYYPLQQARISVGSTLGISNIVVADSVSVTLESGTLLLLHNAAEHQDQPRLDYS